MPLVPHSDELGALARATAGTTRAPRDWCGLAHSASTSDVHDRHSGTGAATPVTTSATGAAHEAKRGETRTPRAATPTPGLGARACTPRTSAALPAPTTFIASAQRSSRELGPLRRTRSLRATPRRALTAPRLRRNCTGSTSREARTDAGYVCQAAATRFSKTSTRTCTDCSDPAVRASSALHDARLTSATGEPRAVSAFSSAPHRGSARPLMSRSRYPGSA